MSVLFILDWLHRPMNNYKNINISDDCTNPPVCQNEGFVKQVNGECSCQCVEGLTGPDCTQLDTSPSKYIMPPSEKKS